MRGGGGGGKIKDKNARNFTKTRTLSTTCRDHHCQYITLLRAQSDSVHPPPTIGTRVFVFSIELIVSPNTKTIPIKRAINKPNEHYYLRQRTLNRWRPMLG